MKLSLIIILFTFSNYISFWLRIFFNIIFVNNDNNGSNWGGNTNNSDLPAGFSNFISEYTDVYISGDYVVVETAGVRTMHHLIGELVTSKLYSHLIQV